MGIIVGIDLGTTNSAIAIMSGDKPTIIPNRYGERLMPSAVRFLDSGAVVVGAPALTARTLDPRNTITEAKRLLGRRYNEVLDIAASTSYEVVRGSQDLALMRTCSGDWAPQYVSGLVLQSLISSAEDWTGQSITKAVIGVPAYFGERQRAATLDAATIAGIEVLRLVAEPTLAAMAYGVGCQRDERIAVIDLGGGTFDVSVLVVGEGVVEVSAIAGDGFFGGTDFDLVLVQWLCDEIVADTHRKVLQSPEIIQRLRDVASAAKHDLTERLEVPIAIPHLRDTNGSSFSFDTVLSRDKFKAIGEELFERLRAPCEQALADAGVTIHDIDRVLLVGGATRMIPVVEFARRFFEREPSRSVNPDEAIALGAAVQAGVMAGTVKDWLLLDVTPLSLGVETAEGRVATMIPRNTTIPTRKSEVFSTTLDDQTSVEIRVVQGEEPLASQNRTLGRFALEDLKAGAAGDAHIEVTFDIDASGILNVSAKDAASEKTSTLKIQAGSGLSKGDLDHLRRAAGRHSCAD